MRWVLTEKKRSKKILIIIIIALLLLLLIQWRLTSYKEDFLQNQMQNISKPIADDSVHTLRTDSLHQEDSLVRSDSINQGSATTLTIQQGKSKGSFQNQFITDSIAMAKMKDSIQQDSIRQDSIRNAMIKDSIRAELVRDSLHADSLKRRDKTPPDAILIPPAGRYDTKITPKVSCDEPKCKGEISLHDSTSNAVASLSISTSSILYWRAIDSLGNATAWKKAQYDLITNEGCGTNAFPVPFAGKIVCVDAYEYPNQADALPRDMVTQPEAVALCAKEGKHLCSLGEWQASCKGKENSKYPYGNQYNERICATTQKKADRSGRKEACRSWWGMYDMSGNLWEWTSTPNASRNSFFEVAGGSWNTQDESSCQSTKFSFYPQNQYPFVGFRCCK